MVVQGSSIEEPTAAGALIGAALELLAIAAGPGAGVGRSGGTDFVEGEWGRESARHSPSVGDQV
jgi:hypothetical protein